MKEILNIFRSCFKEMKNNLRSIITSQTGNDYKILNTDKDPWLLNPG